MNWLAEGFAQITRFIFTYPRGAPLFATTVLMSLCLPAFGIYANSGGCLEAIPNPMPLPKPHMPGKMTSTQHSRIAAWLKRISCTDPLPADLTKRIYALYAASPDLGHCTGVLIQDSLKHFSGLVQIHSREAALGVRAIYDIHSGHTDNQPLMPSIARLPGIKLDGLPYDDAWSFEAASGFSAYVDLHDYVPHQFSPERAISLEEAVVASRHRTDAFTGNVAAAEALLSVWAAVGAFIPIPNGPALVCRRPREMRVDAQGRLGSTHGPALVWPDRTEEWWLCGKPIDPESKQAIQENGDDQQEGLFSVKMPSLLKDSRFWDQAFEERLLAGEHRVLDVDGPWSVGGRPIQNVTRLCQVEWEGHLRHYLCELPEGVTNEGNPTPMRMLRVPASIVKVVAALAWTFDAEPRQMAFSEGKGNC